MVTNRLFETENGKCKQFASLCLGKCAYATVTLRIRRAENRLFGTENGRRKQFSKREFEECIYVRRRFGNNEEAHPLYKRGFLTAVDEFQREVEKGTRKIQKKVFSFL